MCQPPIRSGTVASPGSRSGYVHASDSGLGAVGKAGRRTCDPGPGYGLRAAWQAFGSAIPHRPGAQYRLLISPAVVAIPHTSEHESPGNCWDNAPTERVFRRLKTEWIPTLGYITAQEAQRDISHFLMHRYNWIRPHQFNGELAPAQAEEKLNVVSGIS